MGTSDIGARVGEAAKFLDALHEITAPLALLEQSGSLGRMDALADTVARFEVPVEADPDAEPREGLMALLRAFDRHGEGLTPYSAARRFAPGEVIVDSAPTVWLVDAVDEEGHPTGLIGGVPHADAQPTLVWLPAAAARVWVKDGQQPGTAYRDGEQALRSLAGLWGLSESETRYFKRPEALFWQLTETPGVRFGRAGLEDDAGLKEIRVWLATRGASSLGETALQPGDLVDSPICQGLGLVLAVATEGCDILYIEARAKGPLGEPKGTARILRRAVLPADTILWRPA